MSKAKTPEKSTTESTEKASGASKTSGSGAKKTATSKSQSSTTSSRKAAGRGSASTAKSASNTATAKAVKQTAPVTVSKTHARLLKKMLEERDKLEGQAEDIAEEQRALAADPDAAEISSDIESGDCVASRERDVDLRLAAQLRETIEQIDRATERVHNGTYGDCTRCHAKIPAARLDALPYAELCVTCQQQHERLYY